MTENCYEIGQIQAFLDGELDNDSLEQIARHVSLCDDCAMLLAEAESESAFAFAALDSELNSLVPTERIRANLYEQIAAEKKPFWRKIFGGGFSLTNPSAAAFASLILVAGIFIALFVVRENRQTNVIETAKVEKPETAEPVKNDDQILRNPVKTFDESLVKAASPSNTAAEKTIAGNRAVIQNANYRAVNPAVKNQASKSANKTFNETVVPAKHQGLIGEENYVKTIATLNETVNSRKDEILKPSARVSFEKDLAVVNDSIAKMQKEVRGNPKNEAAKQLLRSAYQNKIDLLNSVADRGEMMATLK